MDPAAVLAPALDDVVDGRAEAAGLLEPETELDALDDVDAHDRRGQGRIQTSVPVDVRAEPDRQPVGHDLEHASDRVSGRARLVDALDHPRLRIGIGTAERRLIGLVARARAVRRIHGHATDLGRERPDLDAELAKEGPRDPARRDPGRRLAGRGPLEDVAHVVEAVLERPGQVGVARSNARDRRRSLVAAVCGRQQLTGLRIGQRRHLHDLGPVLPVTVVDEQQDRRAEGRPMPDAAQDLGTVLLDRLARAPAVPALPAREVHRQRVLGQRQARRHALDRGAKGRSVQFAGGQEAEGGHRSGPWDGGRPGRQSAAAGAAGSAAASGAPAGSPSAERRPPARAATRLSCISASGAF